MQLPICKPMPRVYLFRPPRPRLWISPALSHETPVVDLIVLINITTNILILIHPIIFIIFIIDQRHIRVLAETHRVERRSRLDVIPTQPLLTRYPPPRDFPFLFLAMIAYSLHVRLSLHDLAPCHLGLSCLALYHHPPWDMMCPRERHHMKPPSVQMLPYTPEGINLILVRHGNGPHQHLLLLLAAHFPPSLPDVRSQIDIEAPRP